VFLKGISLAPHRPGYQRTVPDLPGQYGALTDAGLLAQFAGNRHLAFTGYARLGLHDGILLRRVILRNSQVSETTAGPGRVAWGSTVDGVIRPRQKNGRADGGHWLVEGEGSAPLLPYFDNRSTEGFEPFREFTQNPLTSPSSIPLYERTHPTTILRQIGREHSNPPELGTWIDLSAEASLGCSPVSLQLDIRVGFATFASGVHVRSNIILSLRDL